MSDELRTALTLIARNCGQVCDQYETCGHPACEASIYARQTALEVLRSAPAARPTEQRVWVLQKIEDSGVELAGVFRDLERAKHALEGKYPNLRAWERCSRCGDPECEAWVSHTGKHPILIEPTTLDADSARRGESPPGAAGESPESAP